MEDLLSIPDKRLRQLYKEQAKTTVTSYNAYYNEIQRRSRERHARAMEWLAIAGLFVAAVTAFTTIVPLFKSTCW